MRKLSKIHRKRISDAMRGNSNSLGKKWNWPDDSIAKIKGRIIKNRRTGQFKVGQTPWNKNKRMPDSMRKKMRIVASSRIGEKAANWCGGLSFLPYLPAFNDRLKLEIRGRDGFVCKLCGRSEAEHNERLAIHHIDYNKANNDHSNLITLCRGCNSRVNFQREEWTKFFSEKIKELSNQVSN